MKYTAALLLGSASAAMSPLPRDATAFPVFDTLAKATGSDLTATAIKDSYVTVSATLIGGAKGYRNHHYFAPMQKVTANAGAASVLSAMTAPKKSFWENDKANVGSYFAPNASGNEAGNPTGEGWQLCEAITLTTECSVRYFNNALAGTAGNPALTKDRWTAKKTIVKANFKTWTDITGRYQFQFNEDIGLASFYQSSWQDSNAVTDASRWCSEWKKSLDAAGTEVKSEVVNGWNSSTKCNFVLTSAAATVAPVIKLSKNDTRDFLFQWIEYLKEGNLGSEGKLSINDDTGSYFQGAYATASGPFLNPWATIGTTADVTKSENSVWHMFNVPYNYYAGSMGKLRFHSKDAGDWSEYTTMSGDIGIFWKMQGLKKAEYDAFKSKVTTFEDAKKKFEDKLKEKQTADADIFATQIPWADLPARPERPNIPYAYDGPTPDLSKFVGSSPETWKVKATDNKGNASLVTKNFNDAPAEVGTFANRIGYLIATNDISVDAVQKCGHVFGRLGQSDVNMPDQAKPAYFGDTASTAATIIVGFYPKNSSETGITATDKKIELTSKAVIWEADLYTNKVPTKPNDASAVAAANDSVYLGVSAFAVALVASSLY